MRIKTLRLRDVIICRNFQMGYANIKQRGQGLHLRQFARAFIVDDDSKRIVFVSVDGAMISHAVKRDVCTKLFIFLGVHIFNGVQLLLLYFFF